MEDPTIERASVLDFNAVFRLLSTNNLPVADLEHQIDAFTLARSNGTAVGTAGLEVLGELALLRSLCVAEHHRSRGIGVALVSEVVSRALARGVRELYLLTAGAESYFEKLGFVQINREHAPPEIRNTAQFSALCPKSAVCMRRTIGRPLDPEANPSEARSAG